MDPRRLLTFREVALQRSFSRAADELSLTQSAVSQQVAALERELSVRLLDRGRGGVQPTVAGELLLAHAVALDERLTVAATQLAALSRDDQLALRVGAFPSALATIVPAAVARLTATHPGLEAEIVEGSYEELVAAVRSGRVHLAVCFQDAELARREPDGTRRHELMEEPMAVALPTRHRLARRPAVALADLAGERWTAPSRDGLIHRACVAAGFEPRITVVTRDPLAVRAVVHAGLAVTLTPWLLGELFHGVRMLPVERDPPCRSIFALTPDVGTRPLERALLDELHRAVPIRAA